MPDSKSSKKCKGKGNKKTPSRTSHQPSTQTESSKAGGSSHTENVEEHYPAESDIQSLADTTPYSDIPTIHLEDPYYERSVTSPHQEQQIPQSDLGSDTCQTSDDAWSMGPMYDSSSEDKNNENAQGQLTSWAYETSDSKLVFGEVLEKTKWEDCGGSSRP